MGNYSPRMEPGTHRTLRATTKIAAGAAVEITGNDTVGATTGASAKFAGIAQFDCEIGDLATTQSNGVQRPLAAGPVAAGDRVATAANGRVATATTGPTIGLCTKGGADGAPVDIDLNL
jgi:hypothetical protein